MGNNTASKQERQRKKRERERKIEIDSQKKVQILLLRKNAVLLRQINQKISLLSCKTHF